MSYMNNAGFDASDVEDLPEDLNLGAGSYDNVMISKVSSLTSTKSGSPKHFIIVQFKDVDPESNTQGMTFDWFINAPTDAQSAIWFKRNLKTVGLTNEQISELGDLNDPDNADQVDWFVGTEGSLVLTKNGAYTNLKSFQRFASESDSPSNVALSGESIEDALSNWQ